MSTSNAIVSGIAGRYALALFELSKDAKALESTEKDLTALGALLVESDDLAQFVGSPLSSRDEQQKAILAVADKAGFTDLTRKFLGTLAANRRLNMVASVIRAFGLLLSQHRGEITAEVTSAIALSDAQLDALQKKLKVALGQDVSINASVDEELLGGLVVQVGSRMIDSSLKTKLENLTVSMKGVQ